MMNGGVEIYLHGAPKKGHRQSLQGRQDVDPRIVDEDVEP
jgi:hypothetical protein